MATFNRERAKAELGWDDAQINAYLRSEQGRADSMAAVPERPGAPVVGDPLGGVAGMGSAALDAIGGPRTLLYAAGAGALGAGTGFLRNRGKAKQPVPDRTTKPETESAADSRIKEARAAKMEADARAARARADLAERKLAPPPDRTTKPKLAIVDRTKGPVTAREQIVAGKSKGGKPPAATQEQHEAMLARRQKGASKRQLAARAKGMARATPPPMAAEDDLAAQLERSLAAEQVMTQRGIPKGAGRAPLRAGLRSALKGGNALGLLLSLLDAGSIPEQMDEARRITMDPRLARYLEESPIY